MKNILSSLNESEKKRILEMHYKAANRHYLNEQTPSPEVPAGPPAPSTKKTGSEVDNNFPIGDGLFTSMGMSRKTGHTYKVKVSFNYDNGVGSTAFIWNDPVGSTHKYSQNINCKCGTPTGVDVVPIGATRHTWSYSSVEDINKNLNSVETGKWFKERCKIYIQQTDPKCNTKDYIEPSYATDAENYLVSLFDEIQSSESNMGKNTEQYQANLSKIEGLNAELKKMGLDKNTARAKYDQLSDIGRQSRTEEQDVEWDNLHRILINGLQALETSTQGGSPANTESIQKVKVSAKKHICSFINSGRHKKLGLEPVIKAVNGILNNKDYYTTPPNGDLTTMTLDQKGSLFCQG
jgi:hypothetical protein